MAKAIWEGVVLAESNDTVVLEGSHYFPPDSVVTEYLTPSSHMTVCFWKGDANYYNIEVNGKMNENAAWIYRNPSPLAANIRNRIAFWKGVKVEG